MAINVNRNPPRKKKVDKSKIFVLDIDGTLCDIDSVFFLLAYSMGYFGLEVPVSFLDEREYILLSSCGILTKEDESRILTLFNVLKIWERLDPFPGVLDFLQKISSSGHSIIYLTSRNGKLRAQTTNWLKNNGFPRPADSEFGNEEPNGKVTLMMDGGYSKKNHLQKIKNTGRNVYYFENDPFYVNTAFDIGINNIFSFNESYILNHNFDKKIKILKQPKLDAYSKLDGSIFS